MELRVTFTYIVLITASIYIPFSAGNLKGRVPAQQREGWRRRPTPRVGGARITTLLVIYLIFF